MKRFTHNARRITAVAAVAGAFILAPAIARASAGSPARPYASAVTPLCQTPGLVIWLDTTGNGAAGTTFYELHFTNLSGHACTLNGFPFLFAVNLAGHQVGPRAVFRRPPTPHLVTLANGKTATAVLGIVDTGVFSRSACRPVTAAGLWVFPPNQTRPSLSVPLQYLLASTRAGLAQRGSGYQIAPQQAIAGCATHPEGTGMAARRPGTLSAMNAVMARSVAARQRIGTVAVTAVGMFACGAGFGLTPLSLMSLDVIVGGMSQPRRPLAGRPPAPASAR